MIRVVGLAFVVVAVAWLGMYVWLRFATERTLRELREGINESRPDLYPWEQPRVQPKPYDWSEAGEL